MDKKSQLTTLCQIFIAFFLSSCIQDRESSKQATADEEYDSTTKDTNTCRISEENGYFFMERTIVRDKAQTVDIDITVDCGKLDIHGGANSLLEARFKFKDEKRKPVINYQENTNNEGALALYMSKFEPHEENTYNECESFCSLAMDSSVPMNMHITFGAGEGDFNLQGMKIQEIEIEAGAGKFELNLANTSVSKVEMTAGAGEATIDLSGKWVNNLNANFTCGVGKITIILPDYVNIDVHTTGVLGSINADRVMKKNRRDYSHRPDQQSDIDFSIDITGGIGEINLDLQD